jgi:hypothetical protein
VLVELVVVLAYQVLIQYLAASHQLVVVTVVVVVLLPVALVALVVGKVALEVQFHLTTLLELLGKVIKVVLGLPLKMPEVVVVEQVVQE